MARVALAIILALLCIPALAAAQLPTPVGSPVTVLSATVDGVVLGDYATTTLKLINRARVAHGLVEVRLLDVLCTAARAHSREMLTDDYFAHESWNGESLSARLVRYGYSRTGYSSWAVGEVIAWGKGVYSAPAAVFHMWMSSSAHRAVILTGRWRDIGLGIVQGNYRGLKGVYMYTVDFGRRIK
jgi:uncharacterized protein YkwD